ncbi:cytochrome P450 [Asanoa ishikariensis]|uniref:Cytochrome P450 n=1 Tax=Asanoa ishikariensis TaxID=137265 RepID=A0A1H3S3Y9_9ACTN|nr:cytochrome P450 [Asanoa ishikariensis]GIF66586.1 cytochrome P450 [Asanoa ishikariensis]SDZ31879.1 Cytochrome P450 [Asanoa ishikariensis]
MELQLSDPDLMRDPFTAYGRLREQATVAALVAPGLRLWAVTRHAEARAMLGDPRFTLGEESFQHLDVPAHCVPYLRTMQQTTGEEHARLRRLVSPEFSARRGTQFRPTLERIVDTLLDEVDRNVEPDGTVDLVRHFTTPLPMEVICELVGVPKDNRPQWRTYGAAITAGHGAEFVAAVPAIIEGAIKALEAKRTKPGSDLISQLLRSRDDDKLTERELVTFVWHLVLAGQTPASLIANAVPTLLDHPDQLAAFTDNAAPGAVEELLRWCGPQMLTIPRQAREDVKLGGELIPEGARVTAILAAANRDPRVFTEPDRFDVHRTGNNHLSFAHGPHFCLGAPLARVQTEVALTALFARYPGLTLAEPRTERIPDPATWRLQTLRVQLG